ncbi:MAG: hypothetical protein JW869_00920 [Candidatus Omnitrophica bacterium]|nr:hypothetical protein [Candidatus Omnitrophota bacterium]
MKTKIAVFIMLLSLVSVVLLAQQPQAPDAEKEDDLEETKQEIEALLEELKGIESTRNKLEADRAKLRQIMVNNNEISTVKILNTIAIACIEYREAQNLATYPWSLKDLEGYIAEDIIEATDAENALYGYYYKYDYINKDKFKVKAIPAKKGETGNRTFSIDQDQVILDADTNQTPTFDLQNY